jgi:hypothetical protein
MRSRTTSLEKSGSVTISILRTVAPIRLAIGFILRVNWFGGVDLGQLGLIKMITSEFGAEVLDLVARNRDGI